MDVKKPELSAKDRQKMTVIYNFMKHRGEAVTKEELCAQIGWAYNDSNNRKLRDLIAKIAVQCPIISTSDGKGYELITKVGIAEARKLIHQAKENTARAEKILNRNAPIDKLLDKFMTANKIKTIAELERLVG